MLLAPALPGRNRPASASPVASASERAWVDLAERAIDGRVRGHVAEQPVLGTQRFDVGAGLAHWRASAWPGSAPCPDHAAAVGHRPVGSVHLRLPSGAGACPARQPWATPGPIDFAAAALVPSAEAAQAAQAVPPRRRPIRSRRTERAPKGTVTTLGKSGQRRRQTRDHTESGAAV
jgi:hypothetical protein